MSCAHDRRGKRKFFSPFLPVVKQYRGNTVSSRLVFDSSSSIIQLLFFLANECHGTSIFCGITTGFPETLHSLSGRSTTTMHHGVRPESFSRNHFPGYNNTRPEKATSEGRGESPSSFPRCPSLLVNSFLSHGKGKVGLSLTLCYTTHCRGAHVNRREGRKSPTSLLELHVCRLLLSSQCLKGKKPLQSTSLLNPAPKSENLFRLSSLP